MTVRRPPGRRESNMQSKRTRIFTAAEQLFAERGFAASTTQEVAERADVAAGTVFRYASSKSELLLMVYNRILRAAVARGAALAQQYSSIEDRIGAIVATVFDASRVSPENSAAYQRELLFGPPERYRDEGLEVVAQLEHVVATQLHQAIPNLDDTQARLTAASVFAALHLAIARSSTGAHLGRDARSDLHEQIALILSGLPSQRR